MRYQGITTFVTGAASGIGAASASRLAAEGAAVVVFDIDVDGGQRVAAEVGGSFVFLDLCDVEAIPEAVAGAIGEIESLDVLVNCAGWDRAMPFTDTGYEDWQRIISINLLGPIAFTHACLPHLSNGGAIVNVSSDAGRVGSSGEVVYSGAKAGIIGFSKALAREAAARSIRINVVSPGPTDTPFSPPWRTPSQLLEPETIQ